MLQTPFLEKLLAPSQLAEPGEPAAGPREEGGKEISKNKPIFENLHLASKQQQQQKNQREKQLLHFVIKGISHLSVVVDDP